LDKIPLRSPAKINITLDILGKDEKHGKHFVNTILYRDDALFDEIELVSTNSSENSLLCDHPDVPIDGNTILRALELLKVTGWQVTLNKKIPVQSGLGGGSSNAASILKFFGKKLHLGIHELERLGCQIGADVSFFLQEENLVYCEGYGDEVVQGWNINPLNIRYIDTGIKVSTPEAYSSLDLDLCGRQSSQTEMLLKKFQNTENIPAELLEHFIHNDFEYSFFEKHREWTGRGYLCGSGGMLWNFRGSGN
jgi:4-diphosphocytidyl-2-C-methyl-D-erythritol kinase